MGERGRGRPPIIETPEEFDRLVDEYVELRRAEGKRLTITGMALHLGFYGRQSLYQQADREEFYDSVKRASALVEADYEDRLEDRGIPAAGTIFALKNFKWSDKQEHEISGPGGAPIASEIKITHEIIDPSDPS
jgi:hypothetical protein